jgi:hypothetical protein
MATEIQGMKPMAMLLAGLLLAGTAGAGDVYVTRDAKGNTVYTDTPDTLPAERVTVHAQGGKPAAAAQAAQPQATQPATPPQASAQAAPDTTADQAQRCSEARQQYQKLMTSWRLYDEGPNGERTYLTSEQIDQARLNAKQVMDQFCSGQ